MRKLIKKVLREWDDMDWIKDADIVNHIEMPYFKSMEEYGLKPNEYEITLSKVFNQPVSIDDGFQKRVFNKWGFGIYVEDNDGSWEKWEYDANGNEIYGENSYGYWYKKEYDDQGNIIYYQNSDGYWWEYEYDANGNKIYFEDSDGYWKRYEYDDKGNIIYFENSDGEIEDNRNLNESDEMDWIRDVDITDHIEPPYFKNMKEYGLKVNEYESILSKTFNQPVKYKVTVQGYIVYDKQGNQIYFEDSYGYWYKKEYDERGNIIYSINSEGDWIKSEYDERGNIIYRENSNGYIVDNR